VVNQPRESHHSETRMNGSNCVIQITIAAVLSLQNGQSSNED
jgi:hypothetical protein